ncbi:MAG: hypothetical protein A2W93_16260 [Bacteroidetes bacterium GWF2_43_63]|nr:MAG: hypothetical protein A2W94_11255 [Bacteroidetes bacterium GWE2_42_42]OFY54276.1 MAG: hypothetical protein A2W93_16260 [Bacteroidetes bacterium GWF2_43_63]HBG69329.1 hypothetical protein [Bacteroidales bacterium]HCB60382.1 hypothetical protein [Bacteroidales bacterium]HCY23631.1 hypothetical protein [Bacteroidales bacterium]
MHHGPAAEMDKDNSTAKKTKLGIILFLIYLFIYAGFVFIGMVFPKAMGMELFGGQNIAVLYGMGLIILAVLMGIIYNIICTRYENKMNKEKQI